MAELKLPENPTLKDCQVYIRKMVKQRGFEKETSQEVFTLLVEEIGEMAKALRKLEKMKVDVHAKEENLAHEIADVFMYLVAMCNIHKIDLEKAFREKEAINMKRTWK